MESVEYFLNFSIQIHLLIILAVSLKNGSFKRILMLVGCSIEETIEFSVRFCDNKIAVGPEFWFNVGISRDIH